jgi:hypothetical protein
MENMGRQKTGEIRNLSISPTHVGIAPKVVPCEVVKTLYENKAQVYPAFAPFRIVTDAPNYPHCANGIRYSDKSSPV